MITEKQIYGLSSKFKSRHDVVDAANMTVQRIYARRNCQPYIDNFGDNVTIEDIEDYVINLVKDKYVRNRKERHS